MVHGVPGHSVDDLECGTSRSNFCKVVEHVYLLYISPMKRFNLLPTRNSQLKNVDNFQRNAILFFRMRLILVPEKLNPNEDILQIW